MQITDPTTPGTDAAQLGWDDNKPAIPGLPGQRRPNEKPLTPAPRKPSGHIPTAPHAAPSMTRTQVRTALGFTWSETAANAAFGSDA